MEEFSRGFRTVLRYIPRRVLRRTVVISLSCVTVLLLAALNQMDSVHRVWNDIFFPQQHEIPGQCQLPKLNPFHDSITKYMKDPGKLKCTQDFFSTFDGKKLRVFGDGIKSLKYATIRRKDEDDFEALVSEPTDIQLTENNQQKQYLYEGYRGRIEDEKGLAISPLGLDIADDSPLFLQSVRDSHLTHFRLDEKGILVHESSGKCVQPAGSLLNSKDLKGSAVVLHGLCSRLHSRFQITSSGELLHKSSGLCLGTKTSGEKIKAHNLVLTKKCQSFFTMKQVSETVIDSECVKVTATKENGAESTNLHLSVVPKPEVLSRKRDDKQQIRVNFLLVMLDSISNAHFQRTMPKTLKYLKEELGSIIMKGQSIVGDGTTAQLTAMFTGKTEWDFPEARTKISGAKHIDDWNFIFKDLKRHGYSTMYSEEGVLYGTFQYRLRGFKYPPTDHYPRSCLIDFYKNYYKRKSLCFGSYPGFQVLLDYCDSFFRAYPHSPKFAFTILSDVTHDDPNAVKYADIPLKTFLKSLQAKSYLDDTVVIVFGDHGYRFSWVRATIQGQLEERLPFMAVHFPEWFKREYADLYQNMKYNSQYLTSPFDFYATLRHILSYPLYPGNITTGQSLFKKINPETRSCADAGIAKHWCPCLKWEELRVSQAIVSEVANLALEHFNKILTSNRDLTRLCHPLRLKEIINAVKQMPNREVQSFQRTELQHECDGCKPVLGKRSVDTMVKETVYQIQMKTLPNDGLYEVTVTFSQGHSNITGVSRLNTYNDHIECIRESYVHAHKYCFCNNLLDAS